MRWRLPGNTDKEILVDVDLSKVPKVGETPDIFTLAASRFQRQGAAVYYHDPVAFARECIKWKPGEFLTFYQEEILQSLVDKRRVAVRGPHGLGKTTTAAIAVLWFALTRDAEGIDWKVITTAGAWRQLEYYLWPEIHKWAGMLNYERLGIPPFRWERELRVHSLRLRYGMAFAAASTKKEYIEGAHGDSLLYIFDESKAIEADIFDAAEGAFSGAKPVGLPEAFGLAQSTPGEPQGRFYDIHMQKPGFEDWYVRHVTVQDAIAAERISEEWVSQRSKQWGPESALFYNRALGEFHSSAEDSTIPLPWVEAAIERWHDWNNGRVADAPHWVRTFAVDVAYGGGDLTIIAERLGSVVQALHTYNIADTGAITMHAMAHKRSDTDRYIIDAIGVGAGVYDRMKHSDNQTLKHSGSRKSLRRDRSGEFGFTNTRSAMWWNMRELLDPTYGPKLALPPDEDLIGELIAPKWQVTAANKIQVETKDEVRKRVGRSTDKADAVGMVCFYGYDADDLRSGMHGIHAFSSPEELEPEELPRGPRQTERVEIPWRPDEPEGIYEWEDYDWS
jgi:hypothetical protein